MRHVHHVGNMGNVGNVGNVGKVRQIMRSSSTTGYKYSLRSGSKKDICPSCKRRSFTPYVDEDGNALSDEVGRCDHQQSCAYHFTPSEYLKDMSRYSISIARRPYQKNIRRIIQPPPYIDTSDLRPTLGHYERNSLMIYLHSVFDPLIGADGANQVAVGMAVGTSKQFGGSPVFWLIDHTGRIRDGKIMGYNPKDGKRIKEPKPLFNNVHSLMKEKYQGEFKACYFGSHAVLSATDRNLPIWLFESEKGALIASMAFAWGGCKLGLPIATGGCEAFNPTAEHKRDPYDRIRVLKDRDVILFPDEGKYQEWKRKGEALRGFAKSVSVSTVMERSLHPSEVECEINEGDGFDDLLLRYFIAGKDPSSLLLSSYR